MIALLKHKKKKTHSPTLFTRTIHHPNIFQVSSYDLVTEKYPSTERGRGAPLTANNLELRIYRLAEVSWRAAAGEPVDAVKTMAAVHARAG